MRFFYLRDSRGKFGGNDCFLDDSLKMHESDNFDAL